MHDNRTILLTEDGSHTIYNPEIGDIYHSKFGALSESEHIFINTGLKQITSTQQTICILEVGFGTGLNALLSCLYAINNSAGICYYALEPFPLPETIYSKLNYSHQFTETGIQEIFMALHAAPFNKQTAISGNFTLIKVDSPVEEHKLNDKQFDLVYFDAFSPDVQPGVWSQKIFQNIYKATKPNGILVTYSSRGMVKRNLLNAGFNIYKLPGPRGKREIIKAVKPSTSND